MGYSRPRTPNIAHPERSRGRQRPYNPYAGIADAVTNGVVSVSAMVTLHKVNVLETNGSGPFSDVADGTEDVLGQG